MPGRFHALLLLAFSLVVTLWKRAFGRAPRGLALFRANYDEDRLPPVTEAERSELTTFGGCIACGRCDAGDGVTIARSGGAFPGTMALMLSCSRSMPDYDAAVRAFAHVTDEALAEKELLCPTGVPMRRIASFVRAKAREVAAFESDEARAALESATRRG